MKCLILIVSLLCSYQISRAQNIKSKSDSSDSPPTLAVLPTFSDPIPTIELSDIPRYDGKQVKIVDVAYRHKILTNVPYKHKVLDTVIAFGLGNKNGSQALTVIVYGKALVRLKTNDLYGRTVIVEGYILANKENKDPQMLIDDPQNITLTAKK